MNETLLKTQRFDGVVICTENQRHGIRGALSHGCHVIVEFPWHSMPIMNRSCPSQIKGIAASLSTLALKPVSNGCFRQSALSRIDVDFQGGLYRWLADSTTAKQSHISSLEDFKSLSLCGPLTLKDLRYLDQGDGFT